MLNKIMTTAVLMAGATLALAQNAPPAGGTGGGQGAGRMDPAARFKELDKNNDGKVSLEEFNAMTVGRAGGGAGGAGGGGGGPVGSAAGAPAAMPMADRFKAADTNKDGSLTVEEFTGYMQSMRGAGRSGGGTGGGSGGGSGMGGGGMGGG